MTTARIPLVTALAWLLITAAAGAHHSVSGEFDGTQPITLQGVLTRVKWESPHVWLYLDVRDAAGKIVTWGIEAAPPSRIASAGVKEFLKIGQVLTVNAYRARDKSRTDAHVYDLVLPDGRRFVIGIRLN